MTARTDRPLLSRSLIVARALEIVDDTGVGSLSMRSLAADLGVSAPALYDHVDSKETLLRLLAREGYANLAARWEDLDTHELESWIRATSHAYVTFARERPGLFRVMFLYRPAFVLGPSELEDDVATAVFQQGLEVIERAVAGGLLRGATALDFALALWAAMHGAATVQDMSPETGESGWLVDLLIDGLLDGWRAPAESTEGVSTTSRISKPTH